MSRVIPSESQPQATEELHTSELHTSFRRRAFGAFDVAHINGTGLHFAKHTHDAFVLGANCQGDEHVWLEGREMDVGTSDITLYNPGEVQAGAVRCGPWRFYSVYVWPQALSSLLGRSEDGVFARPVITSAPQAEAFRRLAAGALHPDRLPDEVTERMAVVIESLFEGAGRRAVPVAKRHPAVAKVAACLLDTLDAPPPLAALAADVGLTPVQLVRAFHRVYGLPPIAWLFQQRLHLARRLLENGTRSADIAAALGFADQAHFIRRFREAYGVTPGQWGRG